MDDRRWTRLKQFVELACAVSELVDRYANLIEKRDVQIGQRRSFRINDVTAAFNRSGATADDDRRQWAVCMAIAVAETGPKQDDHMVEQRPIAVGNRLQLVEIRREEET